jgi:hypothetical protein
MNVKQRSEKYGDSAFFSASLHNSIARVQFVVHHKFSQIFKNIFTMAIKPVLHLPISRLMMLELMVILLTFRTCDCRIVEALHSIIPEIIAIAPVHFVLFAGRPVCPDALSNKQLVVL